MEMMSYDSDTPFSMPTHLESVWRGIDKFNVQQMLPDGGMPTNVLVGTGSASGTTTFQWKDNAEWWSPSNSYFMLKLRFVKYNGTTPGPIPVINATGQLDFTQCVTYCDNFVSTFFSNIITYIDTVSVDNITYPWVIDQALTYSGAKKDFLETFGSLARVGEPLMKRLYNVGANTSSTNGNVLEVAYRPPASIYNCNLLPPGARHRIDFTWNQSVINAFESLIGSITVGTANGNYNVFIDNFYFYKATCVPHHNISLPPNGVIDLACASVNPYPIVNSSSWQQNISLQPTTNRIYITFQDNNQSLPVTRYDVELTSPYINTATPANNASIKYMGYGTGWTPATSFTKSFSYRTTTSGGATIAALTELKQLYININDLSLILPHPTYNFGVDGSDYLRAYTDWASQTVGTKYNDTGSVPFGYAIRTSLTTADSNFASLKMPGATIIAPNYRVDSTATATYQVGNSTGNTQQLSLITSDVGPGFVADTLTNSFGFQTCEYGWLARSPGPIFVFNICRPSGKRISQGNVSVDFQSAPALVTLNVICCFNRALAVSKTLDGSYAYQLVDGV